MTVMMIMRVYAMWNQSRKILSVLLFIYMGQLVITMINAGIYSGNLTGMSRSESAVSTQSQTGVITLLVTLFSSHGGSNSRFLFLQYSSKHATKPH